MTVAAPAKSHGADRLAGRIALVTGGVGRALAVKPAQDGAPACPVSTADFLE
ncbi:hypothetical protein [Amycolatopsis sp. MEPSY49]|uniref:hypothetical protein n=1 Tax=Amycolatopsis sp. MEPSY49 TaxID=3151600 RepID=UPI003EF3A24C